jgi:diguanylate cyclase (GGDEF)-like protein/PAS domain S-box-containing protein
MLFMSADPTATGAALGKRGEDLWGVFDVIPDAMVGVDRGGVIRFVNRQAEAMFGFDPGTLVGRLIEVLVPESFRAVHQKQRKGYAADPNTRKLGSGPELIGRKQDGTEFPLDIGLAHIGSGDDLLVIAAVRDMTARHESEESRRHADRMAAVVEFSGDAIIASTLDGVITNWNPAAETLFGYTSQEVAGKTASLLSPKDRVHDDVVVVTAKIRAGERVVKLETFGVRKNGEVFPASLTVSAICDEQDTVIGTSAIARDMTEQRKHFEATQRIAAIIESSDDAIIAMTLDGNVTNWNPAAERMYGYHSEEIVAKSIDLLSPPGQAVEIEALLAKIKAGQHVEHLETIRVRKDGTVFPISLSVSPICDPDGAVVGASTIARDVTEQKEATRNAQRLAAAENLVHTVMMSSSVGVALVGQDGLCLIVNHALCDLLGYDEAWFLVHRLDDLLLPDDAKEPLQDRARALAGSIDKRPVALRLVRADGRTIWVRRVEVVIPGGDGQADMLLVQVEDITAEHEANEALTYQAFHDPLTGLHNRAWIMNILKADLRAARRRGTSVGTLFVDVDNLKVVNDSLGHAAGDKVLTAVANRIMAALRQGDRAARFGGDQFVIVVQDVHDVQDVEQCAERVSASIATDLRVHGHRIVPTVSIGIAISTSTSTPQTLLRDTDSALFRAKASGRARWHFFDDAMHAQAVARLTVEDQLRDAITGGQFVVHYQPIVALADAHVVGHEALVRWMHPTRGLLSPADFLDVAEDTGLITTIGTQVLDQACAMLTRRPDLPGPISVNISAVQLAAHDWHSGFTDTLLRHGVDPRRIVIEVTETAVLNLLDSSRQALASLRRLGIGLHVDDFGTGYSSISLLRDLPVTGVKLDLRFVQDLTAGDSLANALAHGLSGLVNGMHLTGIAEGIESKMQADILLAQGWQCGQGYYYGRPGSIPVTECFTDAKIVDQGGVPLPA